MVDKVTAEVRSETMRRVKSKNTSLELKVRSALYKRGLRYRLNYPLPGKPDIIFPKQKIVIFIDSCFWHGCPEHLRKPASNIIYWSEKIKKNIARDKMVNKKYKEMDWKIIRLWEHDLKKDFEKTISNLVHAVKS